MVQQWNPMNVISLTAKQTIILCTRLKPEGLLVGQWLETARKGTFCDIKARNKPLEEEKMLRHTIESNQEKLHVV